jgi:prepilin-type N-terminal cleavage/methylation domain-containing protein
MSRSQAGGVTLVELLVVLAIIGMLLALTLPAVQKARESSRRSTCVDHLRQCVLATACFEERLHRYPGLFDVINNMHAKEDAIPNTTWAVLLLPDLEEQPLYDTYVSGDPARSRVDVFVCPSDVTIGRSGPDLSYVANGGRIGSAADQRVANGPFVNCLVQPLKRTCPGHWVDGKEYTLIYAENLDATVYDIIGWNGFHDPRHWKVDESFVYRERSDRTWSPVFLWSAIDYEQGHINEPIYDIIKDWPPLFPPSFETCDPAAEGRYTSRSCPNPPGHYTPVVARPASSHPGGVHGAFASGRVKFLSDDIDYRVYIALMTLCEKKSDSPNRAFILQDEQIR